MLPDAQFLADLVTFTEEIVNEKLHFLCSEGGVFRHFDKPCFIKISDIKRFHQK